MEVIPRGECLIKVGFTSRVNLRLIETQRVWLETPSLMDHRNPEGSSYHFFPGVFSNGLSPCRKACAILVPVLCENKPLDSKLGYEANGR